MGLFDTVIIDSEVALPEFTGDRNAIEWQTKTIDRPVMRTFRITSDGRLLRKERSYRDLTPEERSEKARERGFESWEAWEAAETPDPLPMWDRTVEEEWWVDHGRHGSFEFHASTAEWRYSYEARFTDGELDDIILLSKNPRTSSRGGEG